MAHRQWVSCAFFARLPIFRLPSNVPKPLTMDDDGVVVVVAAVNVAFVAADVVGVVGFAVAVERAVDGVVVAVV